MFVRGDELLFNSLFQKDNTTLGATVTLFPLSYTVFFDRSSYGGFFTLYSFLSNHLDCTLVIQDMIFWEIASIFTIVGHDCVLCL